MLRLLLFASALSLISCATSDPTLPPVADDLRVVSHLPDGDRIKEDRSGDRDRHTDPYHEREGEGFVTLNKPF